MQARIQRETKIQKLPEIGKVKIGQKVTGGNGKERPTSLDYFRADGNYVRQFHDALGDRPTTIPIVFPSDNIKECCYERYQLRVGSKLYAEGDGEEFEVWDREQKKKVIRKKSEDDKIGKTLLAEARTMDARTSWSTVLTLRFLILPIKSVMGVWSFSTKGEASSIPAIIAAYDSVLSYAKTVVGVPFDLTVEMVKSQKPDSESRFPVVKLVPNLGVEHLNMLHDLIDHGRTFHKVLTAETIEKEVKALPQPEAT